MGSVAETVIGYAPCPVMVVKSDEYICRMKRANNRAVPPSRH